MTNVKDKIEQALELLMKATKVLSEIVEGEGADESDVEAWLKDSKLDDRVELWCRVYNEGGIVTKERLHEIWVDQMGKDVRGLGGFFVGKNASLAWTTDDRVVLTKKASESIESWTGKTIVEFAKKYK